MIYTYIINDTIGLEQLTRGTPEYPIESYIIEDDDSSHYGVYVEQYHNEIRDMVTGTFLNSMVIA